MSARGRCNGGDVFLSTIVVWGRGEGDWVGDNERLHTFFFEGHPETWCGRTLGAGKYEQPILIAPRLRSASKEEGGEVARKFVSSIRSALCLKG